ncbi:MAG TPA: hypothetical protein VNU46_00175 [Gemmatimonadaceae bacterium]|jgi:hypothetical protein|nr:hypothetical protein [Gemmatimonadaceae bacterium]
MRFSTLTILLAMLVSTITVTVIQRCTMTARLTVPLTASPRYTL